jgi:hypothetical protein
MNAPDMKTILAEVERALPGTKWTLMDPHPDAVFYRGESKDGWRYTIASFIRGVRGRGYDGAAVKGTMIMHLTPELAEKAFKLATAEQP